MKLSIVLIFKKNNSILKWKNKQRTLILASRGISGQHRHLIQDLKRLITQSKKKGYNRMDEKADHSQCFEVLSFEK